MRNMQVGFTLIELIAVIVILGILAAVAVPKYVSLANDAYDAQAKAAAGAIASTSAVNYAQRLASDGTRGTAITTATTCTAVGTAFAPSGVVIGTDVSFVTGADTLAGCGTAGAVDTTCKLQSANSGYSGTKTQVTVSVVCTG